MNTSFFDDIENDIQNQYNEDFYDMVEDWIFIDQIYVINKSTIFNFGPDNYTVKPNQINKIDVTNSVKNTRTLEKYIVQNGIEYIKFICYNTRHITNMSHMFLHSELSKIIFNKFNTFNVNNMSYMF